jgi:hypothetical protein
MKDRGAVRVRIVPVSSVERSGPSVRGDGGMGVGVRGLSKDGIHSIVGEYLCRVCFNIRARGVNQKEGRL